MQIKATTSLLRFWLILVLVVRLFAGADHLHLFRGRSVQVCKVGGGRELFHRDQSHWIRGLQCRKDSRLRARLDAEERFTSILKNALHHTHTHTHRLWEEADKQASKGDDGRDKCEMIILSAIYVVADDSLILLLHIGITSFEDYCSPTTSWSHQRMSRNDKSER